MCIRDRDKGKINTARVSPNEHTTNISSKPFIREKKTIIKCVTGGKYTQEVYKTLPFDHWFELWSIELEPYQLTPEEWLLNLKYWVEPPIEDEDYLNE